MSSFNGSFRPDANTIPPHGEIEVARVEYPGNRAEFAVATIVAQRRDDLFYYKVLTDGGNETLNREPAPLPLSFAQVVRLIDRAKHAVAAWWWMIRQDGCPLADLPPFEVTSDHYPRLSEYFAGRARRFIRRRAAK
ncbi:MAG TPA: hypothetical protein VG269_20435 [Tepidisphaeraceae bacterium]|jgi:hypothetical protein|nr:hypothetical protein [Tepidisphaeraceae bacterium]